MFFLPNNLSEQPVAAWSNVDFRHFGPVLELAIANDLGYVERYSAFIDVRGADQLLSEYYLSFFEALVSPDLVPSSAGVNFFFVESDASSSSGGKLLSEIHNIYNMQGESLAAAFQHRSEVAQGESPNHSGGEGFTVNYWKRGHNGAQTTQE